MRLKCEYCNKDAVQIWYGSGLMRLTTMGKKRPILHPLCKDHKNPTAFIPIKKGESK